MILSCLEQMKDPWKCILFTCSSNSYVLINCVFFFNCTVYRLNWLNKDDNDQMMMTMMMMVM